MAKGYERTRYQQSKIQGFYENQDTLMLQKLGEMVSDLYLCTEEREIKRLWSSAHRALLKTKADKVRIATVITERRIGALAKLISELTASGRDGAKPMIGGATGSIKTAAEDQVVGLEGAATQGSPAEQGNAGLPTPIPAKSSSAGPPSHEALKSAMKAFKKRLKLTRLDQESKLGRTPMSSGKKSAVVAIMAPREYPQSVWDELVRQGKLRDAGGGFYELVGTLT